MAIEKTYLLGKNITLGCGFDLQAKAPLDSRQVVPEYDGLQALIDGNAAYEGMIVYDEGTKKTYQAQLVDGVLAFREFGINEAELKALIASETTAAMEFKGAATALPENPSKGDFYKVTTSFDVAEGETAKIGDSIVYDGEQWFIIPSGDDIEDTWRPVTDVDNDATLTFAAGDKLDVAVASNGTVTYSHEAIDAPTATPVGEDEQTRTYIASIETDGYGHITGYKTATENVEDTNTTYEFEGQSDEATSVYFQVKSSEAEAAEVIYLDAYSKNEADTELAKKVDKVEGKSLIDDSEIARLATLANYDDTEVKADIAKKADAEEMTTELGKKVDKVEGYSLVADTEIARLADVDNYDDTQVKADIEKKADAEAMTTELGKKVDKVEGFSLVSDTEIVRLADVDNYDDTEVKADIAKKADAETVTTELAKKVDKVDGHSLVADTEIARLANVDNYNDEEVRGLIGDNAKAIEDLDGYVGTFTHATAKTVVEYINAKTDGIATSGNLEALAGRVTAAEGKITALEGASATHATKDELNAVDAKFADYNTTVAQKTIDDAQDAAIKAIADDYVKAADIANFETKDNVKKVADDLAAYVESNDAALAAETKARTDADAGFETRIAALEGNFGDGEGTVEAQIAAAVAVETEAREAAIKGVQDAVDAVEGRMDTAEGKISDLETASATHAVKTEVEAALALKADKTALEATDKTLAEVKTTVDNFFSDDAAINDTIDTLKEIANYIANDKEGAADITARVGALEGKVDVDKVSTAIADAVKVEADRALAAEATMKAELQAEIDTDVKVVADALAQYKIDNDAAVALKADASTVADMDAAYKAADAELASAIETAKTEAANQDTVVLAESQKYADAAKADAIADAATKYETIGTAQDIVDGLKLSETYEPIGAEGRAIADAEGKINALAGEGNTSTVKKNSDDIATLFEMFQWGEF